MAEVKGVRYCVHCGHYAPQKVVYEVECPGDLVEQDDQLFPVYYERNFLVTCETCSKLLLYVDNNMDHEYAETEKKVDPIVSARKSFWRAELLWPKKFEYDLSDIPYEIVEIYEEASRIKLLAPNAFAVQIRRALEAICLEQGITNESTLHGSLKKLTELGRLPPLLSEVTNIIKVIGNAGAHAGGLSVSYSHVFAIDDFFRVVLEYLYVAPSKLKKFKASVGLSA